MDPKIRYLNFRQVPCRLFRRNPEPNPKTPKPSTRNTLLQRLELSKAPKFGPKIENIETAQARTETSLKSSIAEGLWWCIPSSQFESKAQPPQRRIFQEPKVKIDSLGFRVYGNRASSVARTDFPLENSRMLEVPRWYFTSPAKSLGRSCNYAS